jgi:hypothetical protein
MTISRLVGEILTFRGRSVVGPYETTKIDFEAQAVHGVW